MFFRPTCQLLAYYLTLLLFGLFSLVVSLFSLVAVVLPATDQTEHFFQRLIHRNFALFHWWCRVIGVVRVEYTGFERLPKNGFVLAAQAGMGLTGKTVEHRDGKLVAVD